MITLIAAVAVATLVSLVATPVVRRVAPRFGAVDLPSGRRVNKRVIPRLGGIAILLGFLAPLLGLMVYDTQVALIFRQDLGKALGLIVGAVLMAALGMLDDLRGVRSVRKLLAQIAVAIFAFYAGFQIARIQLPWVGTVELGFLALPLTVLWIVGIVNALNLVDGLDGLAAGVALMCCLVNLVVGIVSESVIVSLISASLAGALVGFLVYNFNPATIFMGDSGSMFIGYVLATTALLGVAGKVATAVSLLVPILAMGLPIVDMLLAIVRRVVERRPIFSPDRGHIHHRLLDLGITHRRAVLILYGASLLFTAAAIAVYIGRAWQIALALGLCTLAIVGLVRAVGMFQFRAVRRMQREQRWSTETDLFRRAFPSYYRELSNATDAEGVAEALRSFAAASKLVLVECAAPDIDGLGSWAWENGVKSDGPANNKRTPARDYVSASFPLQVGDQATGTLKFGWYSEEGDVSPQSDAILRLVVDAFERRLSELAGRPWPIEQGTATLQTAPSQGTGTS